MFWCEKRYKWIMVLGGPKTHHWCYSRFNIKILSLFNSFQSNVPILYFLKTSKVLCFSDVSWFYKNERFSLENYTSNNTTPRGATRVKHNTTQPNTSATRDNAIATWDNTHTTQHNTSTTPHKFYFDLFILSLHTRNLVY